MNAADFFDVNPHNGTDLAQPSAIDAALREARQELRLERARCELMNIRANRYLASNLLRESVYDGYSSNQWGGLVDPFDAVRDPYMQRSGWFLDRGQGKRDGGMRPFLWTEIDIDIQRSLARWIAVKSPFAIGAIDNLANYTIKTGFKYEAAPHAHVSDPVAPKVAGAVNVMLKEFHRINAWPARERSTLLRRIRDGEVFVRHFPQPDGTTWTRFVEPEIINQPMGTGNAWRWGILHAPGDMEMVIAAAVSYDLGGEPEIVRFADDELIHLKGNTDESVKRGLSDFYSTAESFDGIGKLLRNMIIAGGLQAAVAWIEQFTGPNAATINANINASRDANRPNNPNPITGKVLNNQQFQPGTIPKVGAGKEYLPAPVPTGASVHLQIEAAGLRALGARWSMPEYMISGDSSNANFASTLVSGAPWTTAIECKQEIEYAPFFLRSHWVAVRYWCNAGRLIVDGRPYSFEEVQSLVDIHATPPQVSIANKKEDADIDHQDLQDGVTSRQIIAAKRGNDFAKVEADLAEAPVAPPQSPGQPGQPGQSGLSGLSGSDGKPGLRVAPGTGGDQQAVAEAAVQAAAASTATALRESFERMQTKHGPGTARAVILATAGLLREEKDATGHEHASDGRFGTIAGQHDGPKTASGKEKDKPISPTSSFAKAPAVKGAMAQARREGKGKEAKIVLAAETDDDSSTETHSP